jgi:Flp pilus assembly protein TadD
LVLTALLPISAWAFSEEFELALARGEHLFQRGDVAQAAKYFDLCLQIEQGSGRANQYRGVCALELENPAEAIAYLTKARDLEPKNPEVIFDLARARASAGEYDAAWALIASLPDTVRAKPLVRYFEGVTQIGRRNYAAAIAPLREVAALGEPQAFRAAFYLGIVHERMNDPAAAREQYNRVLAKSDDAALNEEVARRVRRMEGRAARGKDWWSATASVGAVYDDNVPLEPDAFDVTDQAGVVGRFHGDVFFRPLRTARGTLGLGVGVRYHPLLAGHEDLKDFDILRASADAATRWELFRARVTGFLGARLHYDYTALSREIRVYSHRGIGELNFDLYEEKWTATRLRYRAAYKHYPDDEDRDGILHEPGIEQYFFFPGRDGTVQIAASGLINSATGDLFYYWGASGTAAVDLRLVWKLFLDADVGYEYRIYPDHPEHRVDGQIDAGGGFYIVPLDWLRVVLGYRYTRNQSVEAYTYGRNVVGLAVEFKH